MSPESPSSTQAQERLETALERVLGPEERVWLQHALEQLEAASNPDDQLALLSARAGRKLGNRPLGKDARPLDTGCGELPLSDWEAKAAGRVLMLLMAVDRHPSREQELITNAYRQGDETERQAIVRGLCLFGSAADLKDLSLETGRANSPPLFSALALANPYPSAHYEDHELNQMVLKVLFLGLPVAQVIGLEKRANAELSRMCGDYLDERLAAKRPIPVDIWLALAPHASVRDEALMLDYLAHDDIGHRYYAAFATGIRTRKHPELRKRLEARLAVETQESVRSLLRTFLLA
jgi:hypothetical protein